jgi:general secretion pathway protein G
MLVGTVNAPSRPVSRRPDRARSGFTLVEILVVVLIITVLAGLVAVNVIHAPGEARVAAARLDINQILTALDLYKMAQGQYPTQDQGLLALVEKPARDPVPRNYPADGYLKGRAVPKDPWGGEYIYLVPGRAGESYEVISYGRDGEPGGTGDAADISSSTLSETK